MAAFSLEGKVALVTGGASGIGFGICEVLAEAGAMVVIADVDAPLAEAQAAGLREAGHRAGHVTLNLADESSVVAGCAKALAEYGTPWLLVNNAGLQHVASIDEFPVEKFEQLLKVMLVAPFLAIKRTFPRMKQQRWGRVVNVASVNGLVGFAGKAGYNSAKHGVIGLTRVAALEGAAHGITVNALCPGYVDTPLVRNQLADLARTRGVPLEKVLEEVIFPLVPQRRLLSIEEIGAAVVYLTSELAGGVTGVPFIVDGGYTAQ